MHETSAERTTNQRPGLRLLTEGGNEVSYASQLT